MDNFLQEYLSYTSGTEVPTFFNRWCCLSGIGALLGRQYSLAHVGKLIQPNLYMMLIGSPGTRKNTAINGMRGLLLQAGYDTIAADKTTKEKFLMDLAGLIGDEELDSKYPKKNSGRSLEAELTEYLNTNLWGTGDDNDSTKPPAEVFIVAPEFNDFLGNGNIEFISLLGNLWDYDGIYKSRIKNGKSIAINDPTISIAGGNTPTGFSLAFPTEIFGQGFFSRLLLVYGEPTGKKIAFPIAPKKENTEHIVRCMKEIKAKSIGVATLTGGAEKLLEKIYNKWPGIDDIRFDSFANRRFTHLLKLCLIVSALYYDKIITERHVVVANTILTHTEYLMPKALGEFGKARNSDVAHKVIRLLESSTIPLTGVEIWEHVDRDLDKMSQLTDMLISLQQAKKIIFMKINGGGPINGGFTVVKKLADFSNNDTVDWSILTQEEKDLT